MMPTAPPTAAAEATAALADALADMVTAYHRGRSREVARLALAAGVTTTRRCHMDPARCLVAAYLTIRVGRVVTVGAISAFVYVHATVDEWEKRDLTRGPRLLVHEYPLPVEVAQVIHDFDGGRLDDMFPLGSPR